MLSAGFYSLNARQFWCALLSLFFCFGVSAASETATETNIYVGVENQIYRDVVQPAYFPIFTFGGDVYKTWTDYEFKADLKLRMGLRNPKAFAPTFQNAYFGEPDQSTASPLRFSFGRRLINWSQIDEMWSLGNIQPLDAWDRMRPRSQGLSGIFAYTETQSFNFRLLLSYSMLPQVDPNVVLENNNFELVHPQSTVTTPQTVTFLNHATPLGYRLHIPSLDKIILRPGFVFMVETKPDLPVIGRFTYGYLPLNYFPLAIQAAATAAINQIVVDVYPRLVHHNIFSGDLGYKITPNITFGVSGLVDDPNTEKLPDDYNYTPISTTWSTSPWIKYEIPNFKITASHLIVNGGVDQDIGNNTVVNPDRSLFSTHVYYRSASLLATEFTPNAATRSVVFAAKYIHEFSIEADWLSGDIFFMTENNWSFVVGGDVITASKDASSNRGAEFLSDLKAFDRVRAGVTYAF